MKTLNLSAILLFLGLTGFSQNIPPDQKIGGFSHPESVVYDDAREVLYVSNMGEKKDGDGFISKVSVEGKILDLKWITGLQDPKGLLVHGDKLYVTDKTRLVEMDIQKGDILRQFRVEGAQSLNDITKDETENIYISDLSGNSNFERNTSGEISLWMHDENLQRPNGLLVVGDAIFVSAWGKNSPGNFIKIDLSSKLIEVLTHKGIGNLDGLQKKDAQSFYVSDWAGGKVYSISANGDSRVVISAEKSVGDILFFEKNHQLILPMNIQNEVWIYKLD
ncbi:MAG: hypothetical protein WBL21_05650 [Salinimicrobium sp.]